MGEGEDGPVTGVRVAVNTIEADEHGNLRAVPTGEEELIECGLVLRSIGYRGRPVDTVPFDERRGLIRGEYAVGWIKRGPSGVIGTNKKDAADTVAKIVADAGAYNTPTQGDGDAIAEWIAERAPDVVTWEGWQAIDAREREQGEPHGRPRIKLVRVADLIAAGRGTPAR